jgi:hypothetical protein
MGIRLPVNPRLVIIRRSALDLGFGASRLKSSGEEWDEE